MDKKSFLVSFFILFVLATTAFANKTAVSIESPQLVKKGTEITIKIAVSHSANNFFHYTNWVYIHANGKEIARWDFSSGNRPESNNFTREIKYTVNEKTEITAMGNCNIHGSAGEVKMLINVE
jgi:desulfoferrodoxin (superoxide reductase-like protein)